MKAPGTDGAGRPAARKGRGSRLARVSLLLGTAVGTLKTLAGEPGMPYDDPRDWGAWPVYRAQVRHPATRIQAADLLRARENIARHRWASSWAEDLLRSAEETLPLLTPEYLGAMAEVTTPGCTGPCPACRDRGLRWHPNGQWSWSPQAPEQLTCQVCKTVYPNNRYPESIEVRSTWDPRQVFRFYGGETFVCFGYTHARPTFSGIIRARKLGHLTGQLRTLALAHAVNGEARYADGARRILLRLAEVLPTYLVRAGYGYGEFADCDPHAAAEHINDLPADELVYPPNKPDRKVYTGYWSASRVGSSGMDGAWVADVTLAYDLTCEAQGAGGPVYLPEERLRIERDVLLEGSYLAACDPDINNKSVGNRAGAAMVGLCVGHPGLVRFGLDGFLRTVDGWFLPDGGTSESAAYAMMTMSGVRPFGEAFRDYTEPDGYRGPDGTRLEHFNACRDTSYGRCWQGLLWTLQGDLRHPPLADSYRTTSIGAAFAELIALAYPTPQHLAFLAEVGGETPAGEAARTAVFYRDPGLTVDREARFELPDVVFPFLAQACLRLGSHGRDGLAVLNASDWGGHHHHDSLDLYLWKDGHELLSDLGYLWDHPDKRMTYRTAAHNLVLLGGKEQAAKGRGGSMHLFGVAPRVRFAEASSNAYPGAQVYRRTCIQIEAAGQAAYLVDIFRAAQGDEPRDYLFHGPCGQFQPIGVELRPAAPESLPREIADLGAQPRSATVPGGWGLRWQVAADYTFLALTPEGGPEELVVLCDGWGQRDHRNTDRGATLPYVVRRRSGARAPDAFVSVFEGAPAGREIVRAARLIPVPADAVVTAVTTEHGVDLVVSQGAVRALAFDWSGQTIETDARLAVIGLPSQPGGKPFAMMAEGTFLRAPQIALAGPAACLQGAVSSWGEAAGDSWFDLTPPLPAGAAVEGLTLHVTGEDGIERAYPIRGLQTAPDATRIFTRLRHEGFPARPSQRWRLPLITAAAAQ